MNRRRFIFPIAIFFGFIVVFWKDDLISFLKSKNNFSSNSKKLITREVSDFRFTNYPDEDSTSEEKLSPKKQQKFGQIKEEIRNTSNMSPEDFQFDLLISEASSAIPRIEDLRTLKLEQVHLTPELIKRAALQLGELAEFIDKHPKKIDDALVFYKECTLEDNYPTSIRTSCYFEVNSLLSKQGKTLIDFPEDAKVPDKIKKLAEKLK